MQLEVTRELVRVLELGEGCAIATLIDAHGSTPQKVGARLLVRADGSTVGTLGGGCIEAEAWEAAKAALASGTPAVLDFELTEDIALDYGLACGGRERIFVDPGFVPGDLEFARAMLRAASGENRGVVLTIVEGDGVGRRIAAWEDGTAAGDIGAAGEEAIAIARRLLNEARPRSTVVTLSTGATAFADVFAEPPEVIIVGGGHVGRAIATVAHFLGYRIAVIDDRDDFANDERFPEAATVIAGDIEGSIDAYPASRNSAIVIVTRGHKYDYQALAAAARSNAGYVGLMGSRRKVALIYRQLLADGVPEERLRDIHAPIGLDIGAVSPEEIAVSVMAEITMERLGGTGRPMRASEKLLERARPRTVA
jgi:xanthine dehydrogenase accessory factor